VLELFFALSQEKREFLLWNYRPMYRRFVNWQEEEDDRERGLQARPAIEGGVAGGGRSCSAALRRRSQELPPKPQHRHMPTRERASARESHSVPEPRALRHNRSSDARPQSIGPI
jgi:hypothetical protein